MNKETLQSYNTRLSNNNDSIDDLIEDINNLPDATGGNEGNSKYAPRTISFYGHTGTELDQELSDLDTSNITSYQYLFASCKQLISVDDFLSTLDTTLITDMKYMFYQSSSLKSIDVTNFNTSNVTDMCSMFSGCSSLTSIDVTNFDTTNVRNMSNMFQGCNQLESLDLSNFVTNSSYDNKLSMSYMFSGCTNLKHLDIRNMALNSSIISYTNMFHNIPKDCEIIVKDDTAKNYASVWESDLTNVKTVAEWEAEQ